MFLQAWIFSIFSIDAVHLLLSRLCLFVCLFGTICGNLYQYLFHSDWNVGYLDKKCHETVNSMRKIASVNFFADIFLKFSWGGRRCLFFSNETNFGKNQHFFVVQFLVFLRHVLLQYSTYIQITDRLEWAIFTKFVFFSLSDPHFF